jgi:hypothetical protein
MSDSITKRMWAAYKQKNPDPVNFFSSMYQTNLQSFFNSEKIQYDIQRTKEDIAVPVPDLTTGYRMNSLNKHTNKEVTPPVLSEAVPINSAQLLDRPAGQDPFAVNDFRANATIKLLDGMVNISNKIRRTIELQASQIFQTGKIALPDYDGGVAFELDYFPKATHFPTTGTAWGTAGATPLADLEALADEILKNGKQTVDLAIFGANAWDKFLLDPTVQALLDNRRMALGSITPVISPGIGGKFMGTITFGSYAVQMWTHIGNYVDPNTNILTRYMDPAKVILRASTGYMQTAFGAVPNIGDALGAVNPAQRLIPGATNRLSNSSEGLDMFTSAWLSDDRKNLFGGVASRPLMVPVAIDTFGAINTLAT